MGEPLSNLIPKSIKLKLISELYVKEDFDIRLEELMKYLFIVSIHSQETFIPVNKKIDSVWHSLIIQTKFYKDLCLKYLPGKRFIDHSSSGLKSFVKSKNLNDLEMMQHMMRWLGLYFKYFGEFSTDQKKYWYSLIFLTENIQM